ncbi:hypothetical protein Esti_006607 [Eimeria stiedai]
MTVCPQSSEAPQVDMGEASTAPSRSVQTLEPFSVSQSPFLSLDGAHAHQELEFSSRSRRLRFRGGLGFNLVLGSLAAAVAVLIALCAAASFWAAFLHLTRRRLSDGKVAESTAGLAACGEKSGDGFGDDAQASNLTEEVEPPPAKKAKVEEESSDADDEGGSQAQTSATGQEESISSVAGAAVGAAATAPEAQSPLESRVSLEQAHGRHTNPQVWPSSRAEDFNSPQTLSLLVYYSPLRFLTPEWDLRREAERQLYQQFGQRPGRSDTAQPGPSHQSASWGDQTAGVDSHGSKVCASARIPFKMAS